MDKTNPIDHPRTYAALMEASDADGAHEVCDLCAKLEEENARLREAGKSLRDEIAELQKRVYELADLRDEAVAANTRHVKLVLGARKRIDAALNALWETHGNGFGTVLEGPIAELQTALDESA